MLGDTDSSLILVKTRQSRMMIYTRYILKLLFAARMLISAYRRGSDGSLPQNRERWEATIWWPEKATDPARLRSHIEAIEATCRPVIQDSAR